MGDVLEVRFRHPHGDIGPFSFPSYTTVQALKERLVQSWPPGGEPGSPHSSYCSVSYWS